MKYQAGGDHWRDNSANALRETIELWWCWGKCCCTQHELRHTTTTEHFFSFQAVSSELWRIIVHDCSKVVAYNSRSPLLLSQATLISLWGSASLLVIRRFRAALPSLVVLVRVASATFAIRTFLGIITAFLVAARSLWWSATLLLAAMRPLRLALFARLRLWLAFLAFLRRFSRTWGYFASLWMIWAAGIFILLFSAWFIWASASTALLLTYDFYGLIWTFWINA